MKLLIQCIALFCCQFIFAQSSANIPEQNLKQDSTNIRSNHSEKKLLDSTSVADKAKGIENEKKSVVTQNIDIVQEINAVLNYKINRIWRKDLYCLVCENFDAGRAA